jgi:5'-methylthioadenosine phosphorylase
MSGLAIVGGNSLIGGELGTDAPEVTVDDGTGAVVVRDLGEAYLLQRHGWGRYTAPHLVDHVANLRALVALGCDRILAINSSGSLRASFGVGTFVLVDDFVALGPTPSTFTDERGHRVPAFDAAWRARILDAWRSGTEVPLHDGGVYWQAIGPRLETPAETRVFAQHADVVGMTMASECVVAGELGLAYASVCVVDNLANGLRSRPLTRHELEAGRALTRGELAKVLDAIVPSLAAQSS